MSRYLSKLRAISELKQATATGVAKHLGIGYETARSAMRRLEAAGFILSVRGRGKVTTPTVTYKLTAQGMEALAAEAEPYVPSDGYAPTAASPAFLDANTLCWRDLHDAMGMGCAVQPKHARPIDCGLDKEPVGRWSA